MLLRLAPAGIASFVFAALSLTLPAQATSIDWEGKYRFEIVDIDNPSLLSKSNILHKNKAYWLNYLELRPTVLASDSLKIRGRFVLGSNNYPGMVSNSLHGSIMGDGTGAATNRNTTNTVDDQQNFGPFRLAEMYMTWEQEYGALIVGRAPLDFGVGMMYSAGNGLFDHWSSARDMLGYKIVSGNMFFFPMLTTINEGNLGTGADDVKEQLFQFGYTNPDSNLSLGFLYANRFASVSGGNDANGSLISPNAGVTNHWKVQDVNLFAKQHGETYRYGLEFGFRNGQTGLKNGGVDVGVQSFGAVIEASYMPGDWSYHFNMGYATGDDSNTADKYEGYVFHRNYDAGFLLFNHPLGDPSFNNSPQRITLDTTVSPHDLLDEDAITNATFFAPSIKWAAFSNFDFQLTYISASLNQEVDVNGGKNLGSEIDLSMTYRPYEKMQWITTIGYFSPGEVFERGAQNKDTNNAYGIITKAAISF